MTGFINRTVELLSPGGDSDSVKAAILAGADAVFLGVGDFNARKRAVNITYEELKELCGIAGERCVKIYLTLNVLALENEFNSLVQLLQDAVNAGINAVILQDYGLLSVVRRVFPDLEIHASTQMTTHNRGQLELLSRAVVSQVNFSRELSLDEISDLADAAHELGMKVEVFVHGAYCVSFSGQCYMSGCLYGNSANRGACVQPCRREYSGRNDRLRPLNLKDNSVFSSAEELLRAGADSLKIEGRIKGYEYVYNTTSAWREQLDRLGKGEAPHVSDSRLDAVFNRSFSDNLIRGRLGSDAFTSDSDDQSLNILDKVKGYSADRKEIAFTDGSSLEEGRTVTIKTTEGNFICTGLLGEKLSPGVFRFRMEHVLKGKIQRGHIVWGQPESMAGKNLKKAVRELSWTEKKKPLRMKLSGSAGSPLTLLAHAEGQQVSVVSEARLEKAEKRPTEKEAVYKQLSRLGNSEFYLETCDLDDLDGDLFIPVKVINQLRRDAVEQLSVQNAEYRIKPVLPVRTEGESLKPGLALLVDNSEILHGIPAGSDITVLFQLPADANGMHQADKVFDSFPDLIPWFPSILIGEQFEAACALLNRRSFRRIATDNSGIAWYAGEKGIPWIAGPMLNGSNGYSLEFFQQYGADGAFLSQELSGSQIHETSIPGDMELWAALISPLLLMKTRHCIVRNCTDCAKVVMDAACLPGCNKSAEIRDDQGNTIRVIKRAGDYNGLYLKNPVLYDHVLADSRTDVYLLDLRTPAADILNNSSLTDLLHITREMTASTGSSLQQKAVDSLLMKFPALQQTRPKRLA